MRIDRRDSARAVGTVVSYTGLSLAAHAAGLGPSSVVSDAITVAAASSFTTGIIRQPSVDAQLFRLRNALNVSSNADSALGLTSVCTPEDVHALKAQMSTELPSGIIAKCWIILGAPPANESLKAVMEKIQNIESRAYRNHPRLDPEIALRIVGALTELSPRDRQALAQRNVHAEWRKRRAALEQCMIEARYHQVLSLEERRIGDATGRGDPDTNSLAKTSPSRHDVPSQDQIAVYFCVTGEPPRPDLGGVAVQRAIRSIERYRMAPIDPIAAKHAVFALLGLHHEHDALLPPHQRATSDLGNFPYSHSHLSQTQALDRYENMVSHPTHVSDAFVGRDGWHYLRGPSDKRGHELIVAARGDVASCFKGRRDRMEQCWGALKGERCAKPLTVSGDTATWTTMKRMQLQKQRKTANGMTDPVEYSWPSTDRTWVEGRERMQAWAEGQLGLKPTARRVSTARIPVTIRRGPPSLA